MKPEARRLIDELRAFAERLHDLALEPDVYRRHFGTYRRAVSEIQRTIEEIETAHHRFDERAQP